MECHIAVRTDRPEIQKLTKYWEDKEPVPWNRVHRIRIRNHVYFSHKRHVKADIKCEQCHGQLAAMAQVRQVSSLKMGWCVSCHEANQAPTDCTICHK
jgi:c(7)-type cytochrome triheme protein